MARKKKTQNLYNVREFETLTCNEEFKDEKGYKYIEEDIFNAFVKFMKEYPLETGKNDIIELIKPVHKRNRKGLYTSYRVMNYVGLIQFGNGYQLQILPKIDFDIDNGEASAEKAASEAKTTKEDEEVRAKKIFIKMLRSLKEFSTKAKVLSDADMMIDSMNIFEIFINMYLQDVRQLVKRGIKSSYVNQEDNLTVYKGKLLVNEHIRHNLAHKERFYVSFDDYLVNRPENKLIKATLLKLQKITESAENTRELRQLLASFDAVEASTNYDKDHAMVVIDRTSSDYEMLVRWSMIFLKNKSFVTFSGKDLARSLLFPMENLFEAYVTKYMKKVFGEQGWTVTEQGKGERNYLFNRLIRDVTDDEGNRIIHEEAHRIFKLKPDMILKKGKRIVIMDTKWKRLSNNRYENYGISQGDMYQMYAYGKRYKTDEIWLLYPQSNETRELNGYKFVSGDGSENDDDKLTVSIFFVDLDKIEKSLAELLHKVDSQSNAELIPENPEIIVTDKENYKRENHEE